MDVRAVIVEELSLLFEKDGLARPDFVDELVLLSTELNSLGFAVLVARLDERLGFDPFSPIDDASVPSTSVSRRASSDRAESCWAIVRLLVGSKLRESHGGPPHFKRPAAKPSYTTRRDSPLDDESRAWVEPKLQELGRRFLQSDFETSENGEAA